MKTVAILLVGAAGAFGLSSALAQAPNATSCQSSPSRAVQEARTTLGQDPSALDTRIRLADALTDQSCYDEAVRVLEAGEEQHPQNAVLEARLRSARSMISEQRYIERVTRAEEVARLQRNQLRCKKLADLAACDEALIARRGDWELLAAKGDALVQRNRPMEALPAYRRAAELHPGNAALQIKMRTLEAQRAAHTAPPPPAVPQAESPAVALRVAAASVPKRRVYSNQAPAGQTH